MGTVICEAVAVRPGALVAARTGVSGASARDKPIETTRRRAFPGFIKFRMSVIQHLSDFLTEFQGLRKTATGVCDFPTKHPDKSGVRVMSRQISVNVDMGHWKRSTRSKD